MKPIDTLYHGSFFRSRLEAKWAVFFDAINTTGRKLKDTVVVDVIGRGRTIPGRWVKGTTKRGTADIHAVIGGRHVSIEVKAGRDRMSDAQHKTKAAIESCGGVYYIARDFESFIKFYQQIIQQSCLTKSH